MDGLRNIQAPDPKICTSPLRGSRSSPGFCGFLGQNRVRANVDVAFGASGWHAPEPHDVTGASLG